MNVPESLSVRSVRRVLIATIPVCGSNFNGSDLYLLLPEVVAGVGAVVGAQVVVVVNPP